MTNGNYFQKFTIVIVILLGTFIFFAFAQALIAASHDNAYNFWKSTWAYAAGVILSIWLGSSIFHFTRAHFTPSTNKKVLQK